MPNEVSPEVRGLLLDVAEAVYRHATDRRAMPRDELKSIVDEVMVDIPEAGTSPEDDRANFEKACAFFEPAVGLMRLPSGEYFDSTAKRLWVEWQAREGERSGG